MKKIFKKLFSIFGYPTPYRKTIYDEVQIRAKCAELLTVGYTYEDIAGILYEARKKAYEQSKPNYEFIIDYLDEYYLKKVIGNYKGKSDD